MISTHKFGLIVSLSCLLCTPLAAMAATDFYKWTDSAGVVHFSETPPKDKNQAAELIRSKQPPPPLPQLSSENSANEKESAETKEPADSEAKTEAPTEEVEQVLKKDIEACRQATDALNSLMTKPIIRKDNKVMTIEEKNMEIKNMKDIMKIHC